MGGHVGALSFAPELLFIRRGLRWVRQPASAFLHREMLELA
jgi:hypothetical protein